MADSKEDKYPLFSGSFQFKSELSSIIFSAAHLPGISESLLQNLVEPNLSIVATQVVVLLLPH